MKKSYLAGFLLVFLCACTMEDAGNKAVFKEMFSGYVQKGPFINGASIFLADLDSNLTQTGVLYQTTVSDNSGKFEQTDFQLSSRFVDMTATGYYFNENTGVVSSAPLTLRALVDVSNSDAANINLLTHLQRSRIDYLVKEDGLTFDTAYVQAMQDVLGIFGFSASEPFSSEALSINQAGDNNALLLAVSVIVQGFRSTGEMSELLANLVTDIRTDGVLNDSTLGTALLDDARLIDLAAVRSNLESRYASLGISTTIPNFETYVNQFIEQSGYVMEKAISYPDSTGYGSNILSDALDTVRANTVYSMSAVLPTGMQLKIVLRNGLWAYYQTGEGPINWTITTYNTSTQSQIFNSDEGGKACDLKLLFDGPDVITIDFYENQSILPTKTKVLTVLPRIVPPVEPENPPSDTTANRVRTHR